MLKRREKWLAIGTAIAVAILLLDRAVLTPVFDQLDVLAGREAQLVSELQKVSRLMDEQRSMRGRWRELTNTGLVTDPSEAERQVLDAVRQWSRDSGLDIRAVQPQRVTGGEALGVIEFQADGRGSMRNVTDFLYSLHTAALPIRVDRVRLSSRNADGQVTIELRLSTIYRRPDTEGRPS